MGRRRTKDVKALLVELTAKPNPPGSVEQKIADFYSSYLDTATINKLGLAPFQADLAAIAALRTHEQVAALVARPGFAGTSPISWCRRSTTRIPTGTSPRSCRAGWACRAATTT